MSNDLVLAVEAADLQAVMRFAKARVVAASVGYEARSDVVVQRPGVALRHAVLRVFSFSEDLVQLQALAPVVIDGRLVEGGVTAEFGFNVWFELGSARLRVLRQTLGPLRWQPRVTREGEVGHPEPRTCVSLLGLAEVWPGIRFWDAFVEAGGHRDDHAVRDRSACCWERADCVTSDVLFRRLHAGEPLTRDVTCPQCNVMIDWALERRTDPLPAAVPIPAAEKRRGRRARRR